jgi:hypothetical protein
MSILDDLCVSLDINLLEIADTLDVEIETKAIKSLKLLGGEELQAKLQVLKDENKELIITLIEEMEKLVDYRNIDEEVVNYFMIISKEVVDKNELKGLLEEKTEYKSYIKRGYRGFSKEADDDNGEFTYTYSLVESKVITSERLAELIKPSFLFHLDTPELYSISDDSYRKLFFDPSRVGKQVIPIINGIGRDELNHLFMWLEKELKF